MHFIESSEDIIRITEEFFYILEFWTISYVISDNGTFNKMITRVIQDLCKIERILILLTLWYSINKNMFHIK